MARNRGRCVCVGVNLLDTMSRKGSMEVTFEKKSEGEERGSPEDTREKSVLGRGHWKCKGPEAEAGLIGVRSKNEASVAGKE